MDVHSAFSLGATEFGMRRAFSLPAVLTCALLASASARASDPEPHAAVRLQCLTAAETREEIHARHLIEPFAALKSAQAQFKAEALTAKLCRLGDAWVYEISLLHRDGRFIHALYDAATGKFLEMRHAREPLPKT